jgi:hypothetical protein
MIATSATSQNWGKKKKKKTLFSNATSSSVSFGEQNDPNSPYFEDLIN